MKISREGREARYKVEREYGYHDWGFEIPYLDFPSNVKVKVIPPFGGAIARFLVADKKEQDKDKWVSVYLDAYSELGICSKPYWEVYPNAEGDTSRFYMNEVEELMAEIVEALL